ncbi:MULTISPECIES: flagellin N-terminal helical domain-containing protein [Alkalimonas]|uniref:Flagellin n=2 Tax=Alkalimonas TaxID=265980 RepID=A0ABU7J3Y3_9GAMM|nr:MULTISPECIES: flagellin [unclassified Alkalimonas]MEE2001191.1 flagellin [Alkalimonas sp. MEB108]MEE2025828.1 flagellin [Alkalimonas sp. MEB004]
MALVVNSNQSSLSSQRLLSNATSGLNATFEKLSSGYRINRAADDAAGLVISGRLTNQVSGLNQAVRNATDAISLVQVTDGAMEEATHSLHRMRVLAIQADNGVNSEADLEALQQEFDQLRQAINSIAQKSEFAGIRLLDGSAGTLEFMIGANAGQKLSIELGASYQTDAAGLNLDGLSLVNDSTEDVLNGIDAALMQLDQARTDYGAIQNSLFSTIKNLSNISENVSASRSRIKDTDYAKETTELTRVQIIQESSTAVLAQANQRPQAALTVLA